MLRRSVSCAGKHSKSEATSEHFKFKIQAALHWKRMADDTSSVLMWSMDALNDEEEEEDCEEELEELEVIFLYHLVRPSVKKKKVRVFIMGGCIYSVSCPWSIKLAVISSGDPRRYLRMSVPQFETLCNTLR